MFESNMSLVVPLKMLPFIIQRRQERLRKAQQDHQQFYESITGTILGDASSSNTGNNAVGQYGRDNPDIASVVSAVERSQRRTSRGQVGGRGKSVSRFDASPVAVTSGRMLTEVATARTASFPNSPVDAGKGDSYDSIVGALRTAADYEVRPRSLVWRRS